MLQWIKNHSSQTFKAVILTGLLLGAAFLFFSPNIALAQSVADPNSTLNQGVQVIQEPLGLPSTDIRTIIANIIRIALGLLGLILVVLIMYAGFLWMTAGGNEEQIGKSKAMLKNAVIGLVIILSAYSIVWFVMRMLGVEGGVGGGPGAAAPGTQNFRGSGALGAVVKDHYPTRGQVGVARNTKIIVTFRKPIRLEEFVDDTTGDKILGNCKANMTDWSKDCDLIKTVGGQLVNQFINIKRADTGEAIPGAAITAVPTTVGGITGIYTIVIKPIADFNKTGGGFLGSPTEEIGYIVRLGSELRLDAEGSPRVFDTTRIGNDYYEWQFKCSTALDTNPPYVSSVFPGLNAKEARNSVIQIDFSEAIDPSGIQGDFGTSPAGYYFLAGENIFLKNNNSSVPVGTFNLTNGYRTLEFTPSVACGVNACGGKIFCLPVCDKPGATCTEDNFQFLLKAARTIGANTFEAQPFSGLMDVSGNALDGNNNKVVDVATTTLPIFNNWLKPDNYAWNFVITKTIDSAAPFLTRVYPGLDASFVTADDPWEMVFSKRMRIEPMYGISIEEQPTPAMRGDNIPLCKVPQVRFGEDSTGVSMNHCPFLDKIKQYYLPSLDSSIEDVHFNCFYPGKGPGEMARDKVSADCKANGDGCCAVTSTINQSFCCNGSVVGASSSTCINNLRAISP